MEPEWDQHPKTVDEVPKRSLIIKYLVSFVWMVLFTVISFWVVGSQRFDQEMTFHLIILFAVAQVILQLFAFMHLNVKQYWMILIFMGIGSMIAVISAIGIILM